MAKGKKRGSDQIPASRWLTMQFIDLIRLFGNTIIWAGVVLFLIQKTSACIVAFAGHTSIANIAVAVAAHLNATITLSLTLAGVTGVLWGNEYRRHRKTRQRLTSRITHLEKVIDPNRESSLLTTEGTTQSGDL